MKMVYVGDFRKKSFTVLDRSDLRYVQDNYFMSDDDVISLSKLINRVDVVYWLDTIDGLFMWDTDKEALYDSLLDRNEWL